MRRSSSKHYPGIDWSRLKDRLVYLPGGLILIYGLWLSLTA